MKTTSLLVLAAALLAIASPRASAAVTVLTSGHVDLDFNYSGGWTVGVHHDSAGTLTPADALFYANPNLSYPSGSAIARPAGSDWNFVGVSAGETFYLMPQTQAPAVVWPGFSSEGTAPNTFAAYAESDPRVSATPARWMTISLLDVTYYGTGDGEVSLWSTGSFGASTVWWSTADGITATDKFLFLEGGHTHLNWGFSDIGYYEVTMKASGYLSGSMTYVESDPVVFNFGLGVTAVPEPSTWALLVGATLALGAMHRRRRSALSR